MRIAINCRSFLKQHYAGIGRYGYNLVKNLAAIDRENQYLLYVKKRLFDSRRVTPHFDAGNFSVKRDFFNRGLARTLGAVDIYHSLSPDFLDIDCERIIVTIHDLIYKAYPQGHTQETLDLSERYFQDILQKAKKIICPSQHTLDDFLKYFPVDRNKVCRIYSGVDKNEFYPLEPQERVIAEKVIAAKGIKEPFILFVGTIEPRKNLKNLVHAYIQLRKRKQFYGKLVVVGMKGWMNDEASDLIEQGGFKNDIILLGYLTNQELCYCYNLAEVFVFPSFYEGFGFPILEAFSCGAAVVTSNRSSCGEIAGNGAAIINPDDPAMIADMVARMINDKHFKEDFRQKGLKRAEEFSFLKTARETLRVYEEIYRS
ncbi:MAG TPA: glycosyltransferase family 1 protein [Candidatus Omnitrophota bacterium]|nr:glycosyltransferase family 1 protein [Candidatus Omnitrophota bacterium]HPD84135.1 glycosyltransferase family 1 protein [Candidatus Omnitrophota bacterium]HRZ02992.1 glycosyltransferase family 1 protein [Candidatus Omnitrophota bacterium]